MAEQVLMLALSPTMEEGTIVTWHKKEGDSVVQSDIICEVETDKATMEYEAVNEGTLLKILVAEGGKAKVGEPIAVVGEPGEPGEDISGMLKEAEQKAEPATQAPGASEPAASPESAALQAEAAPAAGSTGAAVTTPSAPQVPAGQLKASPLARKMATEHSIDMRVLRGSGPAGRIVKRDIEKALRQVASYGPAAAVGVQGPIAPAFIPSAAGPTASGKDERIPVSGKRKIIAQRLAESKFSAPHYYLRIDVDAGEMMAARQRLNARLPKDPAGKVSPNAFLIKFVSETLKKYPVVNSSWQTDEILRFGKIDIALAVAQEDGLITP
ncbi:MAG: dihydrolipoamide acetyltransferase family protein, partial [Spirochaetia bacterium]